MKPSVSWLVILFLFLAVHAAMAAPSMIVLSVEGMT